MYWFESEGGDLIRAWLQLLCLSTWLRWNWFQLHRLFPTKISIYFCKFLRFIRTDIIHVHDLSILMHWYFVIVFEISSRQHWRKVAFYMIPLSIFLQTSTSVNPLNWIIAMLQKKPARTQKVDTFVIVVLGIRKLTAIAQV